MNTQQQQTYPYTQQPQQPQQPQQVSAMPRNRMATQLKFITNGAIEVNLERTSKEVPTLGFQLANVIKKGEQRQGDWSKKFAFQLNPDHELIQLIHVLTRKIDTTQLQYGIQFKYHGASNDKMLSFKFNQDGSLRINGMQKSNNLQVGATIQPTAVAQMITLAFKAYAYRYKISVIEAISLLNMAPIAELPK